MHNPEKLILTAGPSITQKEIDYVGDAVKNGWNRHHSDYIGRFEKELIECTGAKYAVALSHGTAAIHLGLIACGVGAGDEVIVPDLGYISASNAVEYTGAKVVFADVDAGNWGLDPDSVRRCITEKTKAIMPVWMYGSAPKMKELKEISEEKGIPLIEDSCPAIGSKYHGKMAGSIGEIGCFSFQGAKMAVMGQGGALITSDEKMYEKVRSYCHNCRDPNKQFWHTDIGHIYLLSNVQAALGLAQVERVEELVALKRKVFGWYQKRLGDIETISMNEEAEGVRTNYWMSSIVLGNDAGISRDEVRKRLLEKKVDTRPFFYPISSFPMYAARGIRNPVSERIGLNGINLPSGVMLREEEVDYICDAVREILGAGK